MPKRQKNLQSSRLVTEEYLDLRLDLRLQETKEEITGTMRKETAKILQGVDKIVTKFDAMEKENAAHTNLHKRTIDELHGHDQRIKKLEAKV